MSLYKEVQLLQILNDLSIKHLIKLILYENDVMWTNLGQVLYRSIVIWLKSGILIINTWNEYLIYNEYLKSDRMVNFN